MADLAELQERITAEVPPSYIRYVESTPAEALERQGFDPTTLLVLNLERNHQNYPPDNQRCFYLSSDGCGNYYYVHTSADPEKVLYWCHDDGIGMHDPGLRLSTWLPTAEQFSRVDLTPSPDTLYICRTARHGESILDPISLDDWIAAVNETDGIEYRGYREAPNPFTGETIRMDMPGLAVLTADPTHPAARHYLGRAELPATPTNRLVAEALATQLNAGVLSGEGS